MREGWSKLRLTDFVWFQRGFDLPKSKFQKGIVPVLGSTSILGYHNEAKVAAPGVVTGRSGTLGKFQFVNEPFWPHNTSLWIKDFKGNDEKFAYYLLQCLDFSLFNSGGAVPTLNRNVLNSFVISAPDLPTQRKIAGILSAYDDLIENNLKRIKLLEEKAQLMYEEWFVRLRFPDHQTTPINPETNLPQGWEKVNLANLATLRYGFAFNASQFNSDGKGTPIIRIRNIPSSLTSDFTTEVVNEKYLVNKGDLLIGMDGEFYVNTWTGPKAYLVQRVCNVVCKADRYKGLLTEAIKWPIKVFQSSIDGATVAHLGKKHLDQIEIVIPDNKVDLKQFNLLLEERINLSVQNQFLKEARDILLPRLMTGIIDVDDINLKI